jgi:hypothetical protein
MVLTDDPCAGVISATCDQNIQRSKTMIAMVEATSNTKAQLDGEP